MRIVFSTRYTRPVHMSRVQRLNGWVNKGRRVRSARTFLDLAFGK
jgi:hypothetical protein